MTPAGLVPIRIIVYLYKARSKGVLTAVYTLTLYAANTAWRSPTYPPPEVCETIPIDQFGYKGPESDVCARIVRKQLNGGTEHCADPVRA